MKPEEALQKLEKISDKTNTDGYVDLAKPHIEADKILLDLIQWFLEEVKRKNLGEKIAKTFNRIKKWYE